MVYSSKKKASDFMSLAPGGPRVGTAPFSGHAYLGIVLTVTERADRARHRCRAWSFVASCEDRRDLQRSSGAVHCGDFLNDYEGISGYEMFRSDLTLMYLPAIDPGLGQLVEVLLVPMRVARFRLNRAVGADAEWLCDLLNRLGAPLGTRGELGPDYSLSLHSFT